MQNILLQTSLEVRFYHNAHVLPFDVSAIRQQNILFVSPPELAISGNTTSLTRLFIVAFYRYKGN